MNENINTEIETDLDNDIDDIVDDINADVDTNDEDTEIDFEYDENGDIVIPDSDGDEDTSTAEGENVDADEEQDEPNEKKMDITSPSKEVVEPAEAQPSQKDREILALRSKLSALEKQSKDTLTKLGVDSTDAMSGLIKLAAEAEEITPEEYLRRKTEEERKADAVRFLQASEFQKKIKADLAEVQSAYPETRGYDSVSKLPNFERFAQLRDLGLSPKEAYIAANPDGVRASVATATKRQSLNETKSHLKPVVSKESKDNSITISKKEMAEYRELFPSMSDKEIMSLYRQTKKK